MTGPQEARRVGLDALADVTTLLQRVRAAHPTIGLFEAADLQWWWRMPRRTDDIAQLFWFDDRGRPEAAVILTDWGSHVAWDPIVLPGAAPAWVDHVVQRGLAHAAASGFDAVELEVDGDDDVLLAALTGRGFEVTGDGLIESWLAADARPPRSPLADGYRLCRRSEVEDRPHPLAARNGPAVEARLRQTSLYRPDLDLVVVADDGTDAATGLCWYDPVTATGLVEPMRTEDAHQRRGLARHVLTTGVDLLAEAGATRIKICFEPDNEASGPLYRSVGFEPVKACVMLSGPTRLPTTRQR